MSAPFEYEYEYRSAEYEYEDSMARTTAITESRELIVHSKAARFGDVGSSPCLCGVFE